MAADRADEVRRWLAKARDDLRAGGLDLTADPPWYGQSFRKTHDLREVGGSALALDASLEPLLRAAVRLSPFAGVFRYPTEMGEPTREEAEEALATARQVYEAVLVRLPEEVHP